MSAVEGKAVVRQDGLGGLSLTQLGHWRYRRSNLGLLSRSPCRRAAGVIVAEITPAPGVPPSRAREEGA